jgi:hypothetical protein
MKIKARHFNRIKGALPLLVFLFVPMYTGAQQTKDFVFRQNLGVAWNPAKRTGVNAGYRVAMFDNASRFKNSMFSIGANYDLTKWWKVGGEYRFYTSSQTDIHRFQAFSRWEYKKDRFAFLYRVQYQQGQNHFNDEYLQFFPPRRVFRHRFMVRYDYSKKLELYTYAESFSRLKNAELNWYRMRYSIGAEYLYKRRHSFNVELFANDEFNLKRPEDRLTAELSYVFHLDKKKKKKKSAEDKVKAQE